ncbi:hypothetical protein MKK69_25340 [Methylobacterium sp. J-026]|uniref:hypothetical protein n=1 Tax=Methylobacterium sp. J-026 TaxID=2836624 RepID=UPI001FB9F09B|nr:hypothetical protein [Methylobacterium sp. J-026]MCJ2137330.1 hypothetical protein [Methylobacterium sp. J-026]
MAGDIVPQTRGWRAAIATAEEAEPPILRMSGEIELGNTNERPSLSLSEPASPDPSVLVLNLDVIIDGPSELAMHWVGVEFQYLVPEAPPASVRLLWMGVEIAFLSVTA